MKSLIIREANFNKAKTWEEAPNCLYYSRKSPITESVNEDALAIFRFEKGYVLAIADGAGGHPKGEEAASIVLECLEKNLQTKDFKVENVRAHIIDAIESANQTLLGSGIGAKTTLTVCEVFNNAARGYQVGDSTLLICGNKGKLKFRSTSHSPVGYGVEAGLIDDQEALEHPDLHIISNLVGEHDMKIEIGPSVELNPNDSIFLASDGIFDNFRPDDIIEIVRKGSLLEISDLMIKAIQKDIDQRENSKKDDISFVLLKNEA